MRKYGAAIIKGVIITAGLSLYVFHLDDLLSWIVISDMLLFAGAFAVLRVYRKAGARAVLFSRVMAAIFAMVTVTGQTIWNHNDLSGIIGGAGDFIQSAIKFSGFFLLYEALLLRFFLWLENIQSSTKIVWKRIYFTDNARSFFLQWAFIYLAWLPCLLAYWPGTMPYDSPGQIRSSLEFSNMNMQHPIINTAFMGIFYRIALAYNNLELLTILYALAQMLIMSCIFSFVVWYMARISLPVWLRLLSLGFSAFYPFNALFSINMTKDVMHAGAVCLFFVCLMEAARKPKAFFHSFMKMFFFVITGLLFTITRNNAWQALIICIPFLVIHFRRHKMKITALLLSIVILHTGYNALLINVLHTVKGPVAESYPFMMQQFAYVLTKRADTLSERDLADIHSIVPPEAAAEYNPRYADPVKWHETDDNFSDMPKVLGTWLRIGFKYPIDYVTAFLANSMGFWYLDAWINDPMVRRTYIEMAFNTDFDPPFTRRSKIPFLLDMYQKFANVEGDINKAPVVLILMSVALPFWLLVFVFGVLFYQRSRLWIVLAPLASLLFTVMLGPLAYGRYIYPFVALYPAIVGLIVYSAEPKRQARRKEPAAE